MYQLCPQYANIITPSGQIQQIQLAMNPFAAAQQHQQQQQNVIVQQAPVNTQAQVATSQANTIVPNAATSVQVRLECILLLEFVIGVLRVFHPKFTLSNILLVFQ